MVIEFNSHKECLDYIEKNYKEKPKRNISKDQYIILCGKTGPMRRSKTICKWEQEHLLDKKLLHCFCKIKDTITVTDENGIRYNVIVQRIPLSDTYVSDITLLQETSKEKISSYKLRIDNIKILKKEEIKQINGREDVYDVIKITDKEIGF